MAFTLKLNGTAHNIATNPDTIAAQAVGGALFGLTATWRGAITLKGGPVERSNFHDYRSMRMHEVLVVETHSKSTEALGGFGEVPSACDASDERTQVLRSDRADERCGQPLTS